MNQYLKEGPLTKITPELRRFADSLNTEGIQFILDVLNIFDKKFNNNASLKRVSDRYRNTEEIIKEKILWGCTDNAHLFAAVCRAKGIPVKYVEGVWESWLKSDDENHIFGHALNKVYLNKKWYWVDPQAKIFSFHKPNGLVVYKEGLDLIEIGIPNSEELVKQLINFKKDWKKITKI